MRQQVVDLVVDVEDEYVASETAAPIWLGIQGHIKQRGGNARWFAVKVKWELTTRSEVS